ncbi:hypothetical protein [Modicisalibacter coralii]|uniref:hypothetical protein n=1 Tax=Modicisalibacter coralii TaxID=2304602 RepID=UPI00100C23B6|nr:hypothetical protein [Halomonas coralii]
MAKHELFLRELGNDLYVACDEGDADAKRFFSEESVKALMAGDQGGREGYADALKSYAEALLEGSNDQTVSLHDMARQMIASADEMMNPDR